MENLSEVKDRSIQKAFKSIELAKKSVRTGEASFKKMATDRRYAPQGDNAEQDFMSASNRLRGAIRALDKAAVSESKISVEELRRELDEGWIGAKAEKKFDRLIKSFWSSLQSAEMALAKYAGDPAKYAPQLDNAKQDLGVASRNAITVSRLVKGIVSDAKSVGAKSVKEDVDMKAVEENIAPCGAKEAAALVSTGALKTRILIQALEEGMAFLDRPGFVDRFEESKEGDLEEATWLPGEMDDAGRAQVSTVGKKLGHDSISAMALCSHVLKAAKMPKVASAADSMFETEAEIEFQGGRDPGFWFGSLIEGPDLALAKKTAQSLKSTPKKAMAFCVALLEEVNAHGAAKKLNTLFNAKGGAMKEDNEAGLEEGKGPNPMDLSKEAAKRFKGGLRSLGFKMSTQSTGKYGSASLVVDVHGMPLHVTFGIGEHSPREMYIWIRTPAGKHDKGVWETIKRSTELALWKARNQFDKFGKTRMDTDGRLNLTVSDIGVDKEEKAMLGYPSVISDFGTALAKELRKVEHVIYSRMNGLIGALEDVELDEATLKTHAVGQWRLEWYPAGEHSNGFVRATHPEHGERIVATYYREKGKYRLDAESGSTGYKMIARMKQRAMPYIMRKLADEFGRDTLKEDVDLESNNETSEEGAMSNMRSVLERITEKHSDELSEALAKSDKAVLDAFLDKKEASGKKLSTDGGRLDGDWMGGMGIAQWEGNKIIFKDLGSKAAEKIQKQLKKMAPANYKFEDVDLEEASGKLGYYEFSGKAQRDKFWKKIKELGYDYRTVARPTDTQVSLVIGNVAGKDLGEIKSFMMRLGGKAVSEDIDLEESMSTAEREMIEDLWGMATNDGDSYRKRDAKGAVEKAFKMYLKHRREEAEGDFNAIKKGLIADLKKRWSKKNEDEDFGGDDLEESNADDEALAWLKSKESDKLAKNIGMSGGKKTFTKGSGYRLGSVEWRKGDEFVRAALTNTMGPGLQISLFKGKYENGGPIFTASIPTKTASIWFDTDRKLKIGKFK